MVWATIYVKPRHIKTKPGDFIKFEVLYTIEPLFCALMCSRRLKVVEDETLIYEHPEELPCTFGTLGRLIIGPLQVPKKPGRHIWRFRILIKCWWDKDYWVAAEDKVVIEVMKEVVEKPPTVKPKVETIAIPITVLTIVGISIAITNLTHRRYRL